MKKTTISIEIETEKLRAIQFYAAKKETTLEAEIEEFVAKTYEKYVPAQTREYIESMEEALELPRPRPSRPARSKDVPDTAKEET